MSIRHGRLQLERIGRDNVQPARLSGARTAFPDGLDGVQEFRLFKFTGNAQRTGQIIGADDKAVHAFNHQDRINGFDGQVVFDLHDHHRFSRLPVQILFEIVAISLRPSQADAANALGRIARGGHGLARIVGGIDHGNDDAGRAGIHHPLGLVGIIRRQAHQRRDTAKIYSADKVARLRNRHDAVFKINDQPVEARPGKNFTDGGIGKRDPRTDGRLTPVQLRFQRFAAHLSGTL